MKKVFYIIISMILPILLLRDIADTISITSIKSEQAGGISDLVWEPTSALEWPVNYSAAQVVKIGDRQFVYLVGGETLTNPSIQAVFVAEVFQDGTLSEWKPTTPLSSNARFGIARHKLVVVGEQIYAIAGIVDGQESKNVYCAHPLPNGEIQSWTPITIGNILTKRQNHAVVSIGDRIYVIGGWASGAPLNTIYSGKTLPNCGPIEWLNENSTLIHPLSSMDAISIRLNDQKSMIYVVGGWNNGPSNLIYFSTVDLLPNGSQILGKWQTSTLTLEEPLYFHSVFAIQNQMFVAGGMVPTNSGDYTQTGKVYRILVDSNGKLTSLSELSPLGFDIFGHSSVVAGNQQAYMIGGSKIHFRNGQTQDERLVYYTPFIWLTKSASSREEVFLGDQITYTLHYTNNGLRPLTNLIITDEIPANTFLIHPEYPPTTRLLTWTVPFLAINHSGSLSFTVQVAPPVTAVSHTLSPIASTPTVPGIDPGTNCSNSGAGCGCQSRPNCHPTATPSPVATTPAPTITPTPAPTTTRMPIPVINQAWLCEGNWCIYSNQVFNAPYHTYLPAIMR